jgi:AAA+ superfamily predicted ATPase
MLIFEDFFQDNRHDWSVGDSEQSTKKIEFNSYLLKHKKDGSNWLGWNSANGSNFYDRKFFHMHVVFENVKNLHEENHFGIVWRLSNASNFFEFIISGDRQYTIRKVENGCYQILAFWQHCDEIKPLKGINILEIKKDNESWEFYINSSLVETLPVDRSLLGESFGFAIYNKTKIKVHSLIITASSGGKNNLSKHETKSSFSEREPPNDDSLEKVLADINLLIGLDRTKQQLFSLVNFLMVQTEREKRGLKFVKTNMHLVLSGPPGTGKTTVARLIGRLYKQLGFLQRGHVVETDRSGIVGGYLGQTALRMDDAVKQALDGVLFIDEAHTLTVAGSSNDYGAEAVQVLVKRMEDHRHELAVVVAGYTREMADFIKANPGLHSRFTRQLYFEHYTPIELISIFKQLCDDHGYLIDLPAFLALQSIFKDAYTNRSKSFGNARFARTIFERSIENHANRIKESLSEADNKMLSLITPEDLEDTDD